MDRPSITTTRSMWVYADMRVTSLSPAQGEALSANYTDVRATLYVAGDEEVPIVFTVSNNGIRRFKKLIAKRVAVKMNGHIGTKGRFHPDALVVTNVRSLRKGIYSPRALTT